MSGGRWLHSLLRARQAAEDSAKANLASAQRHAGEAHDRVHHSADRLASLTETGSPETASSFVAAAVALQAAAATYAAAVAAAKYADRETANARGDLAEAAVSRRSAEELAARRAAAEQARQAALAQQSTDEAAASVFRRKQRQGDAQ